MRRREFAILLAMSGAGTVLMHANYRRIHHLDRCIMGGGRRVHDPAPESAGLQPAD
jgi:hypothetical protein